MRWIVALPLALVGCASVPLGKCTQLPIQGNLAKRSDGALLLSFVKEEVCWGAAEASREKRPKTMDGTGEGALVAIAVAGVLTAFEVAEEKSKPPPPPDVHRSQRLEPVEGGVFKSCGLAPRPNVKGVVLTTDEAKLLSRGCLTLNGEDVMLSQASMAWVQ